MIHPTLLTLCLLGAPTRAIDGDREGPDNWPAWRGPLANGTAPNADPPTTWGEGKNVLWKAPLPGRGSATPAVWGDRVFVVSAVQTERKAGADELSKPDPRFDRKTTPPTHFYRFIVQCLDRKTGQELWKQVAAERVPHEGHHETHSYAAGSPATDGKRLYVSFGSFGIYCYDLNGKPLWSRDLGRINSRLGWGEAVTPVVHGDALLLNWDQEAESALICLDARTSKDRWKAERPGEKTSWNAPLVVKHGERTQVIVNGTGRARAYDLATGKVLWEVGGMTVNAIPSAVADDRAAYLMSGYRGSAAVAVPLEARGDLGTSTDKVLWRYNKGTPYVPSPLLAGGRLYFTAMNGNLLTVLDARTGKPLVEQERLPAVKSFYGSPIAAAGRVYLIDRDGVGLVLKEGDNLEVLATNRIDDAVDASPVAVGRQLLLRGHKYLYCIQE